LGLRLKSGKEKLRHEMVAALWRRAEKRLPLFQLVPAHSTEVQADECPLCAEIDVPDRRPLSASEEQVPVLGGAFTPPRA
jgi:hypothetical protein